MLAIAQDLLVPPETFLGKNISEVLPAELAERIMGCFERLDGTVETQVLEYSLAIHGEERHFEARMVSAEGDKVLSIVRDVTESRRAAAALRNSEEKLLLSNRQSRELAARLITAQESERRRIALLLHDDLSQNIAAMGVAISRLKRKPPATNELMAAELDQLGAQTNELTTQIRRCHTSYIRTCSNMSDWSPRWNRKWRSLVTTSRSKLNSRPSLRVNTFRWM